MRAKELDATAVQQQLNKLHSSWTQSDQAINRELKFKSFAEAMGFMSAIAIVADKMDHHPEWFNVYNIVRVKITSHDYKNYTDFDFKLAQAMDALYEKMK